MSHGPAFLQEKTMFKHVGQKSQALVPTQIFVCRKRVVRAAAQRSDEYFRRSARLNCCNANQGPGAVPVGDGAACVVAAC